MNGEPLKRTVLITNSQGLHLRPITQFVETANRFRSSVQVCRPGQAKVNGKSPFALLGLVAEKGTELEIEAEGEDACSVLDALAELIRKLPEEDN